MVHSIAGKRLEYFEAILQLRDVPEELIAEAYAEIERAKIHIAKTEKFKTGIDVYLADGAFTKNLAKSLQQKYGGKYQVTASLFSKHDGQEVYRITVLFRGLSFSRNDIVEYKGDDYKIQALGKEIVLNHLITSKKKHLKYAEMEKVRKKTK